MCDKLNAKCIINRTSSTKIAIMNISDYFSIYLPKADTVKTVGLYCNQIEANLFEVHFLKKTFSKVIKLSEIFILYS